MIEQAISKVTAGREEEEDEEENDESFEESEWRTELDLY